jgi:hypothetical protein
LIFFSWHYQCLLLWISLFDVPIIKRIGSDKPSKVRRNSPKRVDSSKERGYNNWFSKEVSSSTKILFSSLFSMEVLRKLLFNIHLGHNPLRQDSFE